MSNNEGQSRQNKDFKKNHKGYNNKDKSKQNGYQQKQIINRKSSQNEIKSKNVQINSKRSFLDREKEEEKILENVKNSLNEFFYYDSEKQKYFRKREEYKNGILEGKEVGSIDMIDDIKVSKVEHFYRIYDMTYFEANVIKLDPRQLLKSFQKPNRIYEEFLCFYKLFDLIQEMKYEYMTHHIINQPLSISSKSKYITINEYKTNVKSYDFSSHTDYVLIILAVHNQAQNTIKFIIICLNKYHQVQIIKLVPNINYSNFIKVIILPKQFTSQIPTSQSYQHNQQFQNNPINQSSQISLENQPSPSLSEQESIDYGIYCTKLSIVIFKYELVNIQTIVQSFVEELKSNQMIIDVQNFKKNQILILSLKDIKCYDILKKQWIFQIQLGNYHAQLFRVCYQNMLAVVYTESSKLLVVCLKEKRCLFATVMTNLTDIQATCECLFNINFVYSRLNNNIQFLNLRKEGDRWNWTKIESNSDNNNQRLILTLKYVKIGYGEDETIVLQNNIFMKNNIVGMFDEQSKIIPYKDITKKQENSYNDFEDLHPELLFQTNQALFLLYYNDYNIQIQYFKQM